MSFWDHRFTAFVFGFVGGLGVNVFRLYAMSQSLKEDRPDFDSVYWSQFILLAGLGGATALAHDISNPISPLVALNVGLSIPALIKTAAELQTPKKKRRIG